MFQTIASTRTASGIETTLSALALTVRFQVASRFSPWLVCSRCRSAHSGSAFVPRRKQSDAEQAGADRDHRGEQSRPVSQRRGCSCRRAPPGITGRPPAADTSDVETLVLRPTRLVRSSFDGLGTLFAVAVAYGVVSGHADWSVTVLIAAVVGGLVGLHRVRLAVTAEELVSCGGYRTHRWPKADIQQFVILKQGLVGKAVGVVLTDGTSATLPGASFVGSGSDAREVQARLGTWLTAAPAP